MLNYIGTKLANMVYNVDMVKKNKIEKRKKNLLYTGVTPSGTV